MKKVLIALTACMVLMVSCKKKTSTPEEEAADPNKMKYPGKISSFAGFDVFYNSDGLLTSYSYPDQQSANQKVTVTLKWEATKMTFHNTSVWGTSNAVYNRNTLGNCLESSQDIFNHWQYDSLNRLKTLNTVSYYWTNQNVDSIQYYGLVEIYEYSSALETRDFGRKFIPALPQLTPYFSRNLRSKSIRLNGARDTLNINYYSYQFDAANRVIQQTEKVVASSTSQVTYVSNFSYYE